MNTPLWKLNVSDFWRGLIVAVLASVLTVILDLLQAGSVIDWKSVGTVALIAGCSYLLKNLTTAKDGSVLGGKVRLPDSK
jgi:hypothetical protein